MYKPEELTFRTAKESAKEIKKIDVSGLDPRIKGIKIIVASDVRNLLLGKTGAARVYAPQKGATPEIVQNLESGMRHFSRAVYRRLGQRMDTIIGGGAAGGIAAGLVCFLGAKIQSGAEMMVDLTRLERYIKSADLVIAGEGKLDRQTVYGKTVSGVLKLTRKYRVPVFCVAGSVTEEAQILYNYGVRGMFSIIQSPMSLNEAMKKTPELLIRTGINIGHLLKLRGKFFC